MKSLVKWYIVVHGVLRRLGEGVWLAWGCWGLDGNSSIATTSLHGPRQTDRQTDRQMYPGDYWFPWFREIVTKWIVSLFLFIFLFLSFVLSLPTSLFLSLTQYTRTHTDTHKHAHSYTHIRTYTHQLHINFLFFSHVRRSEKETMALICTQSQGASVPNCALTG